MKKLLIILLLFISVFVQAQYRSVDWRFIPDSMVIVTTDTYLFKAEIRDYNDPGATNRTVGDYVVDFIGNVYKVIDSTLTTLTVFDEFSTGYSPQLHQIARCYRPVVDGDVRFNSVGGVNYFPLDESAKWKLNAKDNELLARAIDTANTNIDSLFGKVVNKASTLQAFTGLRHDSLYMTPRTNAEFSRAINVKYWGNEENVYLDTFNLQAKSVEVKHVAFDSTVQVSSEKFRMYADTTDRTISVNLGNGVVMQINQETLIKVYNNTSDTLKNGRILFGSGINGESITVDLANKNERYSALLIATEEILPNSYGLAVELAGKVRGLNTLSLSKAPIYVDTLGLVTNIQPEFPNYIYPIGAVTKVDATEGIIQFRSDGVNFYNSIRAAFDGSIRESFDFRTFVEGGVIKGVLTNPTGATSLTLVFSSGWFDFVVPDTIDLTAGTSGLTGVLTDNYIYIPEDTKELTLSTSAFPDDEFTKVAVITLSDVTNTILTGAYGNQNINNHFKSDNDNGHLIHAFDWIRWQPAGWGRTGLATSLIAGTSSMQWTATGGIVRQFHKQTLVALDMVLGDYMLVKNDPDYPFRPVTDAGYLSKFSDGSNWSATWATLIVWVIGNKTGEESHLVLNIPSDGYNTETAAMDDINGYADYAIPENFISKGILLGKYAVRRVGTAYTHNPSTGYLDLRGTIPSLAPGGGGGGSSGVTDYTQLNQTPSVLEALAFQRVDVTGVTLENVLAENILLTEFDSTDFRLTQSQVIGLVDSLAEQRIDINTNTTNIQLNNDSININKDSIIANELRIEQNETDISTLESSSHAAVTLAGTPDYITLSGQVITRNQIDLTTDVTGNLPDGNIASATNWNNAADSIPELRTDINTNISDISDLQDSITDHRTDIDNANAAITINAGNIQNNVDSLVVHRTDINTNIQNISDNSDSLAIHLDTLQAHNIRINNNVDSLVIHRTDINQNTNDIASLNDSIDEHRIDIDQNASDIAAIEVPEFATTLEAFTGLSDSTLMNPQTNAEFNRAMSMPIYGAEENLYTDFNMSMDTAKANVIELDGTVLDLNNIAYTNQSNTFTADQSIEKTTAQLTINGTSATTAIVRLESSGTFVGGLFAQSTGRLDFYSGSSSFIQAKNPFAFVELASAPTTGVAKTYYNNIEKKLYSYIDGAWVDLGQSGGGSIDYISNVSFGSNTLTFTGVGSAFNSTASNVAGTNLDNDFSVNQSITKSAAQLTLDGTSGTSAVLRFETSGVFNGGLFAQTTGDLDIYHGTGGVFNLKGLAAKTTETKIVYVNESTGEISYGASGSSPSFGTDKQIPYMNAAGTDFIYSNSLQFTGTTFAVSSAILTEQLIATDFLDLREVSTDPSDPQSGQAKFWLSDGTGSGDAGDIMVKINNGSTTKTITLIDFSAF